ncbi:MAG: apolipoprotein N-acyltransferase [Limnohabitans sp.]|nr:apolipoprotein N-acyltransferase [Limnohabitans sp.]
MSMWRLALSVVAGVVHGFSMAWPAFVLGDVLGVSGQSSGFLQCFSLGILAAILLQVASQDAQPTSFIASQQVQSKSKRQGQLVWRQGALISAVFATSAMAATWGWLYVSMHRYGGLPSWLAALAVLLLAAGLSLYFAAAGGVWVALFRRSILSARMTEGRYATQTDDMTLAEFKQGFFGILLFGALWTLAELCRGQLLTGFPWGAGGYAHLQSTLAGYAPWLGVYGMGAIAAWAAMGVPVVVSILMAGRTKAWLMLGLILIMVSVLIPIGLQNSGAEFTQAAGKLKVRLLQGNIPQDEKFIPGQGVQQALTWYGEQLLANTEPLVVTPETAIPVLPQQLSPPYWQAIKNKYAPPVAQNQLADQKPDQLSVPLPVAPQTALIGLPMGAAGVGYTNSALAIGPEEVAYRYDKLHLVPFGEYVPPFFQWFVRMMNMPLGDFAQDRPPAGVLKWQGQRLLPQICYEDLFGEEMARYFAKPEQAPTVFVNMSNLAWFGDTTAIPQHVAISRMRALEFQRPILRATNTGLTGLVDAKGEVTASLPNFTRGSLVLEFEGRVGLTPYAHWTSQWGLAPLWWLCIAIVLVLGVVSWRSGPRAL